MSDINWLKIILFIFSAAIAIGTLCLAKHGRPKLAKALICTIVLSTIIGIILEHQDTQKYIKQQKEATDWRNKAEDAFKKIDEQHSVIMKKEERIVELEKKIFNVSSYNQRGGMTAGEINIGNVPRVFDEQVASALNQNLPSDKNEPIEITCVMGDQEAFQFAEQIKRYLLSEGWDVTGVTRAMFSNPISGQIIERKPDGGIKIIIGGNQR